MLALLHKRYRKINRRIHRASMGLAGVLWFALAIAFGAAFLSGVAPRNPLPFLALFAASCVAPLILAGILESILQRLLLARFRRLFQRPA